MFSEWKNVFLASVLIFTTNEKKYFKTVQSPPLFYTPLSNQPRSESSIFLNKPPPSPRPTHFPPSHLMVTRDINFVKMFS